MKRSLLTALMAAMVLSGSLLLAQPMPGGKGMQGHPGKMMGQGNPGQMMMNRIPNLTEEQKDQIKALRLEMMKKALPVRNLIAEKRARLRSLQTEKNVNLKKVNALIDEIAGLKADIAKMRAAKKQQIRRLLTEEQRIIFDSRPLRMNRGKKGACRHHGAGRHPGL